MISNETAYAITCAYREIEVAEGLLAAIVDTMHKDEAPDVRDAFGRRQRALQLGVPSGENGRRLFDVPWSLAKPILEAHIAHHRAAIAALTEKARAEMGVQP